MAEAMTMNKVIHGAVRRDLARFAAALDSFPEGSKDRAVRLSTAWKFFYGELDQHHHGEHEIAWPALTAVGVQTSVLDEMDAEHERMAGALAQADLAFTALEQEPTETNAKSARAVVADLEQVVAEHFAHEERELEPVYHDKRNTPEIKAMGRAFAKRNPLRSGDFVAWVQNGATPQERAALRESMPPPVVAVLGLLGQRYRRTVAPVWR